MRILIIANADKPRVRPALDQMLPWLRQRVEVVGVDTDDETDMSRLQADAILVLGGDGTLLSAARRLHGRQIPLLGVNFGRLGFLAGFTPAQFEKHFDDFVQGKLPISPRRALQTSVVPTDCHISADDGEAVVAHRRFVSTALNDAVVTAGPPFHMIELHITVGGDGGIRYFGDGVIVSTASGSTAYNVSAGGPIISPTVDAFCITPICPQSLSFRSVVISGDSRICINASKLNAGTTLFCDGQDSTALHVGERIIIRRSKEPVLLIENPDTREWRTLAEKLNWAAGPAHTGG
ncbi:MAG TPA: NAD(+)/NADH kinase [Tepidisphaeraceae bacterium]|nr:NAD(+)/NADH kinase [Tepidisphaeraceae bacterium]